MMIIELKKIEEGIIPIYESESKQRLINARELFFALRGKETKYNDWIKDRIMKYKFEENVDFIGFSFFNEKPIGGRQQKNTI